MEREPDPRTQRDKEQSQQYGGGENPDDYRKDVGRPYYDKPDHAERSTYHQPQHDEHWKKEEKRQ